MKMEYEKELMKAYPVFQTQPKYTKIDFQRKLNEINAEEYEMQSASQDMEMENRNYVQELNAVFSEEPKWSSLKSMKSTIQEKANMYQNRNGRRKQRMDDEIDALKGMWRSTGFKNKMYSIW